MGKKGESAPTARPPPPSSAPLFRLASRLVSRLAVAVDRPRVFGASDGGAPGSRSIVGRGGNRWPVDRRPLGDGSIPRENR